MVNARPSSSFPEPADPDVGLQPTPGPAAGHRFNVLLTEDRRRPLEHWTRQLPRLVEPLGIHAQLAGSAREALVLAERQTFHAVVTDLATPVEANDSATVHAGSDGGLWLLQVLQRRPDRPPVIVVNSRATRQQAVRLLNEALRLGAFSVVNRPANLHPLLTAIQRLLDRHHHGQWPAPSAPPQ